MVQLSQKPIMYEVNRPTSNFGQVKCGHGLVQCHKNQSASLNSANVSMGPDLHDVMLNKCMKCSELKVYMPYPKYLDNSN